MKEKENNLLRVLKKFPDQNPNPVMQITDEGILKYYNEPSKLIVNEMGLEIDKKVVSWLLDEIKKTIDIDVHTFEIDLNLKSFQFKSVYIKELSSINLYGTDTTARKAIDTFPESNPNPVLRVTYKGILTYFNPATKNLAKALDLRLNEKVPGELLKTIGEVYITKEITFSEINADNKTYFASFVPVKEFDFIIVYATDITASKVINKFPDQNPNPVLRVNHKGELSYFNKASDYIIKRWKINLDDKVPENIISMLKVKPNMDKSLNFELEVGAKVFLFNLVNILEFEFFLLYGTDITDSKDKERILNKLSKYFSPQVYSSIFTGQLDVKINTSRKTLTVFFSDIKSFTTITEKLEPEILTDLITNYLTEMTNIAIKYGGTVDKYIGDAIMIFFGDPNTKGKKEDAISCIAMALEMRSRLKFLRKAWKSAGLSESLDVRMGIHTDVCTVGNFGSQDRLDYTVLGNGVNLASRLESSANANEILISENTYNVIKSYFKCNFFKEINIKGRSHSIKTYKVEEKISKEERMQTIQINRDGFSISIDKDRVKDVSEIVTLLENSIEKLTD